MDRRLATVAVLLVVVLAGCVGGGTDETVTPLAVPSVDAPAATDRPDPPGVERTEITDVQRLLDAHQAVVGSSGGVITINRTVRRAGGRAAILRRVETTARFGTDPRRLVLTQRFRSPTVYPNQTVEVYHDTRNHYARVANESRVWYNDLSNTSVRRYQNQTAVFEVSGALVCGEWRPNGTTTIGGERAAVFRLEGDSQGLTDASGYMAVTGDGAVRRLSIRTANTDRRVWLTYRYDPGGDVQIRTPDWLPEAREQGV